MVGNYINEATRIENSYAGYEKVGAAYGMFTVTPMRNLKLIAGGRLESTDIFVQSKIVQVVGETPDSTNTGEINVPQGQITCTCNQQQNGSGKSERGENRNHNREYHP